METKSVPPASGSSIHDCLSLQWVFGLNRDFKGVVYNISDPQSKRICYSVSHTAVIYDVYNHTQHLLQGHRNPIVTSCCSANKRFIVTADAGNDAVMIIWDTVNCIPVKMIPIDAVGGVLACDISKDTYYITTLSAGKSQKIALWGWTMEGDESEKPLYITEITANDEQNIIRFHPEDSHYVVTSGRKRIIFWSWAEDKWKYYSPAVLLKMLRQPIGNLTQSIYVPGTTMAASGTVDGDVILWDTIKKDSSTKLIDKTLMKVVRIHNSGITFLSHVGKYIVTGGLEGYIRFLDSQLRIVAWFEELHGGPIISVSFDPFIRPDENISFQPKGTSGVKPSTTLIDDPASLSFNAPDFVVSTANAMIIDISASSFKSTDLDLQRGKLIVQGQDQAIMAIAAHPHLPRLALGGYSGNLHLWEYTSHRVLLLSIFKNLLIHCIVFDKQGLYLCLGFTNGVVKILDAQTLEELQTFKPNSPDCITRIVFSHDFHYFVTADCEGCVALYCFTHRAQDPRKPIEWVYIGRHRSHRAPITGLEFGVDSQTGAPRLMSLGEDKRLVEYNMAASGIEEGLVVQCAHKIMESAIPTGMVWTNELLIHPDCVPKSFVEAASSGAAVGQKSLDLAEGFDALIIVSDEYKLKIHVADASRQCVKTTLGPTFGGPPHKLVPVIPSNRTTSPGCLVYVTQEQVMGVIQLPLDGNPYKSMGLIAHPLEISDMCVSYDGQYVFTCGGRDCSVAQWKINSDALSAEPKGRVLDHYVSVIEGGTNGTFMKEIIDYFYYAQIRAQGEETTKKRTIMGTIPFSQVSNLMRALAYYPSEKEILQMTYEIYTEFGAPDCNVDEININFESFIRLYVNHRPVFGIRKHDIENAFKAIGADQKTGLIERDVLLKTLEQRAEPMDRGEIERCFKSLLGDDVTLDMLEDNITAKVFAENLLGFEDYSEAGAGEGEH